MIDLQLEVPAYHVFEFQQILSAAGISYERLDRTNINSPFNFQITTTAEKAVLAEKLLADMDIYSAVSYVTDRKLDETLNRAASFGLEVVCNNVAFRILDKPYLHRVEVKGSEGALNRFYSNKKLSPSRLEQELDTTVFLTPSRGGSGKGTVAHIKTPDPVKS
jgi:hypothetical protein